MFVRFHGDPSNISFDKIAPSPSCATVFAVEKIVSQIKETKSIFPSSWRSFDLRTSYYDNEIKFKTRRYFTIRWNLPPIKRFDNTKVSQVDSVLQVTGQLLGRVVVQNARYLFLECLISSLNYISPLGVTGRKSSADAKEVGENIFNQLSSS